MQNKNNHHSKHKHRGHYKYGNRVDSKEPIQPTQETVFNDNFQQQYQIFSKPIDQINAPEVPNNITEELKVNESDKTNSQIYSDSHNFRHKGRFHDKEGSHSKFKDGFSRGHKKRDDNKFSKHSHGHKKYQDQNILDKPLIEVSFFKKVFVKST